MLISSSKARRMTITPALKKEDEEDKEEEEEFYQDQPDRWMRFLQQSVVASSRRVLSQFPPARRLRLRVAIKLPPIFV
jgi:hypothetical protein